MDSIATILPIIQITSSVILIVSILLQQSSAGLGGAFGGNDSGVTYHTRRGFEKVVFVTTIIFGVIFVASALLAIVLQSSR